jgi:hypothetical protein
MTVVHNKWAGLITNGSPYALPPGAATVQVNLSTATPGQLTSRQGMLPVLFVETAPALVDVYPYAHEGKTFMVGLSDTGELLALESPAAGESSAPSEPDLTANANEVRTSYTMRYLEGGSSGATDIQPELPPELATNVLDGNTAHEYYVDAESLCDGDKENAFDGGRAGTSTFRNTVRLDRLCDL